MHEVRREDIRKPAVADAFYPGDPALLEKEIDRLMDQTGESHTRGRIKGLISPHAGYMYSGIVAARGYKSLRDADFSVVAIISPSHRDYFRGISVFNGKGYETPLGLVPIDSKLTNALIEQSPKICSSWLGHREEHALEVQLPFLQRMLKNFRLIPIVMGDQEFDTCWMLAEALSAVLKDVAALIVASSDLSHFHVYDEAVRMDHTTIDLIQKLDVDGFIDALEKGHCEACGAGPIISTMITSKNTGANTSQSLMYANSGDITGDRSSVVGYLSTAFCELN